MARDKYHDIVKAALIKDGWTITDDPFRLKLDETTSVNIDLGAERLLAAEKEEEKIAVEIKSFLSVSQITDFYHALGQFNVYILALEENHSDRILFLAVPLGAYKTFFKKEIALRAVKRYDLNIIVYNRDTEEIVLWIK